MKIGMIFEKDDNGNYFYKSTEQFDDRENLNKLYDENYVVQIDEEKYTSIKDKIDTTLMISDVQAKQKVIFELSDSLCEILFKECESKGYDKDISIDVIKKLLDYIAKSIDTLKFEQRGNILSFTMQFEKTQEEVNENQVSDDTKDVSEEEKPKIDMSKVNPEEIINNIKQKVIAQDKTVETIVNNIYNNQLIIDSKNENLINSSKASILMDGPTGTGKTLILKQVAKELSIPMIIRSSTMYSAAGYKGSDLSEILVGLLEKTNGDLELAERGIVVLDEFDKLASNGDSELEMKKAVQQEMLTYLSGSKFPVEYQGKTYEFDTSKITFIALGAFTDLRERKIREELDKDGYYLMKPEDYIKEGILREIVGRFSLITATQSLGKDDLINILKNSEISPLIQLQNLAQDIYNKKIVYSEEIVDKIATDALAEDTGARALQTVINGIRDVILPELRNESINVIEITDEILTKSNEVDRRKGVKK